MSTFVKLYVQYWLEIGILLGISSKRLDDIEREFVNDSQSCCLRMLVEWVMSDPNASWKKLKGVVKGISMSHGSNKSSDGTTKSGRYCTEACLNSLLHLQLYSTTSDNNLQTCFFCRSREATTT